MHGVNNIKSLEIKFGMW